MPLLRLSPPEIAALDAAGELDHILPDLRPLSVDLSQLILDPNNARKHGKKNSESIKGSLVLYGQRVLPVVNARNCIVEKGNGTIALMRALGWKYAAVAGADDDQLSAMGFALADNRTAELAEWDVSVQAPQLETLRGLGFDLPGIGFEEADVDDALRLFRELDPTGEGDEGDDGDEAGEFENDGALLAKAGVTMNEPRHVVSAGEVWRMGRHTLVCVNVLLGWPAYKEFLQGDTIFAPYPGPFLMLTEQAHERPFLLVQPDVFIAGHMLDQWDNVHGEGDAKRISGD